MENKEVKKFIASYTNVYKKLKKLEEKFEINQTKQNKKIDAQSKKSQKTY